MRAILTISMAFLLAAPCIALADKKKASSGKDGPSESISLNYGKTQNTYKQTNSRQPGPAVKAGWDVNRNRKN
jgi:type VI protein secretion system component Hcp